LYWTGASDDTIDIHTVPEAGHESILEEPHVSLWAKELNRYLNKVGQQRKRSGHDTARMQTEYDLI
jgi:thioesterase domain-containing protein